MAQFGILAKLVNACVQHSKCKAKFNGELSGDFSVKTGLRRQGDALSLLLLNIAKESMAREVLDDAIDLSLAGERYITLEEYADD